MLGIDICFFSYSNNDIYFHIASIEDCRFQYKSSISLIMSSELSK